MKKNVSNGNFVVFSELLVLMRLFHLLVEQNRKKMEKKMSKELKRKKYDVSREKDDVLVCTPTK